MWVTQIELYAELLSIWPNWPQMGRTYVSGADVHAWDWGCVCGGQVDGQMVVRRLWQSGSPGRCRAYARIHG